MYCTECGTRGEGKFCANCGHSLPGEGKYAVEPAGGDWSNSVDYSVVTANREVQDRLAQATARGEQRLSGDDVAGIVDRVMQPLTGGLSSRVAAKLSKPMTRALGIQTGKSRREFMMAPPGRVMVRLLEVLAEHGQKVLRVEQGEETCRINATIPFDWRSFDGELAVTVSRATGGTYLDAEARVEGQWYDWGKCTKQLDRLFLGVRAA